MKKVLFILIIFFSHTSFALETSWQAGKFKTKLIQTKRFNYTSQSCKDDCSLKRLIKSEKVILENHELAGGRNPGSPICKKIKAQVIFLSNGKFSQAFCMLNEKEIIDLNLVYALYLQK